MKDRSALVIFVKTKSLSPVKTRLASAIGIEQAHTFYDLAIEATADLAVAVQERVDDLDVYWAVAEPQALQASEWSRFPTIYQGHGDLGGRLAFVYSDVLSKYSYVCFMGGDSPHLTVSKLAQAVLLTKQYGQREFILGETEDGGFYFFGSGLEVPHRLWTSVVYSQKNTAQELCGQLSRLGPVRKLEMDFDIDTKADLLRYKDLSLEGLLPTQTQLIDWARRQV